jgi:DNA-binding CsgD family transcriptional regulator
MPRELSVLRWLSLGHRIAEIGKDKGLGEETVRSHIKKAPAKLGARNAMHAVAHAVRVASALKLAPARKVSRCRHFHSDVLSRATGDKRVKRDSVG